jgi:hypothetical protein
VREGELGKSVSISLKTADVEAMPNLKILKIV